MACSQSRDNTHTGRAFVENELRPVTWRRTDSCCSLSPCLPSCSAWQAFVDYFQLRPYIYGSSGDAASPAPQRTRRQGGDLGRSKMSMSPWVVGFE
jgi:hypothetical protein